MYVCHKRGYLTHCNGTKIKEKNKSKMKEEASKEREIEIG